MRLRHTIAIAAAAAATIASFAIAATAGPLASLAQAPVAGAWVLSPGEYYVELSGSSFHTTTAFDDNSNRGLIGMEAQQRVTNAYAELGWHKHTSLQFSLPFVSATVKPGSGAATSIAGLGDFGLGYRRVLKQSGTAAALQLRWEAPAGYNPKLTPATGDGQQKLSAGLEFGGRMGKTAFWQLGGGYRYDFRSVATRSAKDDATASAPAKNWADHATVHAAYAFWVGHLQISGLYGADIPVQTGRTYDVAQHVAGPRLTYRVDGGLDVFAGSWHTPMGQNAAHVDQYYAGIAWKATKLNRAQGFLGNDQRP